MAAPNILARRPRILYLDAYDSFSNNIIALVEQSTDADVVKFPIDGDPSFLSARDQISTVPCAKAQTALNNDKIATFVERLRSFDAVIAGPGPGWAECDKDVGLMKALWTLQDADVLPILGICLGFQSMCLAFGATIEKLKEPQHGLVSEILHDSRSIFSGVEQLFATQYHSLQVSISHRIQTKRAIRYPKELWEITESCPVLEPLAWDFSNKMNGAVLMGVKHSSKPFWGVQFHPESICTNTEGQRLVQNWCNEVQLWQRTRHIHPSTRKSLSLPIVPESMAFEDHVQDSLNLPEEVASLIAFGDGKALPNLPPTKVHCATIGSGRLLASDIVEAFDLPRNEAIVLESGLQSDLLPVAAGTGRHSIIGLVLPGETMRLHYYGGDKKMQLRDGNDKVYREWHCSNPWQWIKACMTALKQMVHFTPTTKTLAPFWGGLMGYGSYEAGLETIDVHPSGTASYPDICFAYITRSIVVDHQLKKIYVQSIRGPDEKAWVDDALDIVYDAVGRKSQETTPNPTPRPKNNPFDRDATLNTYLASCRQVVADRPEYCASVASCQRHIADGQSYELCLTNANKIRARRPRECRLSKGENNELSWKLYKRLTSQNPAPFSAYMRLHNVHVLSSSPERYISWDRSQKAQCRPIKGTVAKKSGVTAADAHAILSSSKERAENLMIVDLVRHQLHGVYGSGNVHVQQLMEVEEYETLWQLVSVVDAIPKAINKPRTPDEWEDSTDYMSVPPNKSSSTEGTDYLGFDAFAASLPPGSMTGAPKKRSCELLQSEEGLQRRGIYSGVLGYFDIGGGGDFSVIIRTAVKVDNASPTSSTEDEWSIGAGGAITAQSIPEHEYDEMLAKFQSTARAFMAPAPAQLRPLPGFDVSKLNALASLSSLMRSGEDSVEGEEDREEDFTRPLMETLETLQEQLMMLQRENSRVAERWE